jgi:hypothetical protein
MYMIGNFPFFKMPSPSGRTWRPNIALILSGRWFVYWGNLNFFSRSPFLLGHFPLCTKFCTLQNCRFFDFVETQCQMIASVGFVVSKHILKGRASLWSGLGDFYLVFLELSCVMWMLESLEFGLCTLKLHSATCTCAYYLQFLCFALYGWGCKLELGVRLWVGCKHAAIANGQSLLRLGSTPLIMHAIVACLLPNVLSPWLI